MKMTVLTAIASLAASGCCGAAMAEPLTLPSSQTEGSSYPNSSQLGAPPNIPDPVHGTPGESYREPDRNLPSLNKTTVYDPEEPSKPGDTRPTVPGNPDSIDSPGSDDSRIVTPEPMRR